MKSLKIISSLAVAGVLFVPSSFVFANDVAVDLRTNIEASTTLGKTGLRGDVKAEIKSNRIQNAKTHADQEIDRRVKSLNELNAKVAAMTRVSASVKTSLSTSLQGQINSLMTLKAKIDADTATDTLKADIQSVTKSYRIFMLIIPQARIAAAADVIKTIGASMTTLGTKLEARITAASGAGKDTTSLTTLLADMKTKITEANMQADAAVSASAALTPDNGDQAKMQANEQALKDAKAKLKLASQALKTAREDIRKIIVGLKTFNLNVTASSTTSI